MIGWSDRTSGRCSFVRFLLLLTIALGIPCARAAESAPVSAPRIRRLLVPADLPRQWPAGDWHPWPLAEFEKALTAFRQRAPSPRSVVITNATYSATLVNEQLRGGLCTLEVKRSGPASAFLALEPWNLAVSELRWKDRPAIWGSDRQNRTQLLVDRTEGTLEGAWSLAGRSLPQALEFSLDLPPAIVSQISIRLPAGQLLQCQQGDVSGPVPAEAGWNLWKIGLGSRNQAQVLVLRSSVPSANRPLLITRREITYAVRPEAVRLQTDFRLEILEAPIRELRWHGSPDLKVIGITLGDNTPLSWTETLVPTGRILTAKLADPLDGQGNLIRIQALTSPQTERSWPLPQLRLIDAVHIDGQVNINVFPPLELADFQIDGYRQTALITSTTDGETIVLRQLQPEGEAQILLASPRFQARCRLLTHVQTWGQSWTSTTHFEWSTPSGSAFSVRCGLPPEWEVSDVRDAEGDVAGNVISWELLRPPGTAPVLRVEFRESLAPERVQRFRVICRATAAPLRKSVPIPLFSAPTNAEFEQLVSIATESTASPALDQVNQVEIVGPSDFPNDAAAQSWKNSSAGSFPGGLLLKSRGPKPSGSFLLQAARDLADVQASGRTEVTQQKIVERFQLQISPRNAPLKRVLVYLTQGMRTNGRSEPPTWKSADDPNRALEAQRLDSTAHAAWNLPGTGELWEVRLPTPMASEFTITGARSRSLTDVENLTLVHVPHANLFEGRIQVDYEAQASLRLEPRNLEPVTDSAEKSAATTFAGRRQVWKYRDITAEIVCQLAGQRDSTSSLVVSSLEVGSRLSLEESSADIYWATFRLSEFLDGQKFRWSLPQEAELLQVVRDGARVVPNRNGDEWELFSVERRPKYVVQMQYRVPAASRIGANRRVLSLPRTPHSLLRFDLFVMIPDSMRVDLSNSQLSLSDYPAARSWRNLLFGPFARSQKEFPFRPWIASDWSPIRPESKREVEHQFGHIPARELNAALPQGMWPVGSAIDGWQVLQYSTPSQPDEIAIIFWSNRQVWQFCWIALSLGIGAIVLLRMLRTRLTSAVGLAAIVATVLLSVALSGVPSEIAGSATLGVIIGALLPIRWSVQLSSRTARHTPKVPGGSTRSFPQPISITVLLISALNVLTAATLTFAEDEKPVRSGTRTEAAPGVADNVYDVLIPVDKKGKPSGSIPLAYLPAALHQRLSTKRDVVTTNPEYLVTSANYTTKIAAFQPFTVVARYEVIVLTPQPEVAVYFPFRNVNLGGENGCLVDGQPHAVLSVEQGPGCKLLLSGQIPRILSDNTAGRRTTPASASSRKYTIEFRLHPNVANRGKVLEAECGIPPLISSRGSITVESGEQIAWIRSRCKNQHDLAMREMSSPADPKAFSYGKGSDLIWQWSSEPPATATAIETLWRFSTVLDIDPMLLQFHCRLHGQATEGSVSSLQWRLPSEMAVRSIQGEDVLDWRLTSLPQGERLVSIAFGKPKSGPFVVTAELVMPLRSAMNGMLTIPRLPLPSCGESGSGASRASLYQVAFRPPTDFKMDEVMPAQPAKVRTMTLEKFRREHSVDGSRPAIPFEFDEPQSVSLRLQTLRPLMQAETTTIHRFSRDRLDLTFVTNIDTRGAPGFRYRLQVDPRLRISSVSVIEDGAERLLRWNVAANDQVLVFLNDRTTHRQTLRVDAHMPITVPAQIELPRIQLKYADQREDRISVYYDTALNMRLAETSHLRPLPPDPTEQFPTGRELPLGRYSLNPDAPPVKATITRNSPDIVSDRLYLIQPQEKSWKLSLGLRLGIKQGRGSEFQLVVPRKWVPVSEVITEPASRQISSLQADGSLRLVLIPEEPITESFHVTLRFPISARLGGASDLPEVDVPGSRAGRTFVLSPSRGVSAGTRISGKPLEHFDPSGLPASFHSLLSEVGVEGDWIGTTIDNLPVRLQIPNTDSNRGELPRIILAENQLMLDHVACQGRLLLWLPPDSGEQLELVWPAQLEPIAVLVDGVMASYSGPKADRLTIPLHASAAGQSVLVCWKAPPVPPGTLLTLASFQVPVPRSGVIDAQLLEIIPPAGYQLHANQKSASTGKLAMQRWEGLIRWQEAQLSLNTSDEHLSATDRAITASANATERLFRRWRQQGGQLATPADWSRFTELRSRLGDDANGLEEFRRPAPNSPATQDLPAELSVAWPIANLPWNTCRLSLPEKPSTELIWSKPASATSAWIKGLIWGVAAAVIAGIAIRLRPIRWLKKQDGIALALIGLLWWCCLIHGGLGIALILAGIVSAASQWWKQRQIAPKPSVEFSSPARP